MKVIIGDSSIVDRHGTRILVEGIILDAFLLNPVVLMEHEGEWLPIGRIENIRIEGTQLVGDLILDEDETEPHVKRFINKIKNGFIRGVSVGGVVISESHDTALKLPGQTGATIESLMLYEVSIAVMPSNPNSVIVRSLNRFEIAKPQNKPHMLEKLKKKLGLPDTATEADVEAAVEAQIARTAPETQPAQTVQDTNAAITELTRTITALTAKVEEIKGVAQLKDQIERSAPDDKDLPVGLRVSNYLRTKKD